MSARVRVKLQVGVDRLVGLAVLSPLVLEEEEPGLQPEEVQLEVDYHHLDFFWKRSGSGVTSNAFISNTVVFLISHVVGRVELNNLVELDREVDLVPRAVVPAVHLPYGLQVLPGALVLVVPDAAHGGFLKKIVRKYVDRNVRL